MPGKHAVHPIGEGRVLGRQLNGKTSSKILKSRAVQRVETDKDGHIHGHGLRDHVTKAAPLGLVLAELVENEQIGTLGKTGRDQSDRHLEGRGIKAATPREWPEILTDAQDRAFGQDPDIHVARAGIGAPGIDLDGAAAAQATVQKIGGQPLQDQIGVTPPRCHGAGKPHVIAPQA